MGTDGNAYGSKERREANGKTEKAGHFSDLSMKFSYGKMPEEGLLIVEIKPPKKTRNGQRPDFIKLCNEMKDATDKLIKDGMDDVDITVIGVLVEGYRCTLLVMDLLYHAIYRLIPLTIFYLPRDRYDFAVLTDTFEALATMRKMTSSNARKCFAFNRKRVRQVVRGDYVVPSYDTPSRMN
ncbi:hypothetical protein DFQ30_001186 [Apophysomyces sp. BC1015]|nr:hypothetical protein DFQ30_001186 [Apophysomyces sp. BC1015]